MPPCKDIVRAGFLFLLLVTTVIICLCSLKHFKAHQTHPNEPWAKYDPDIKTSMCTHKTVKSLAKTEEKMKEINYYYPSPIEHLWVKAHGSMVTLFCGECLQTVSGNRPAGLTMYLVQIRRPAFYDDRDTPAIVVNSVYNCYNKRQPKLYSLLIYDGFEIGPCLKLSYWSTIGTLQEHRGEYYGTRLLRLELKAFKTKLPKYMSVTEDSKCKKCLSDLIPVENTRNRVTKNYTFGACLHNALYNAVDPQRVMEWIEVQRLLGAETITIYFQDDLEDVYNAILPYVREGIIEVYNWGLRPPVIKGDTRAHAQRSVINECVYRNLYSTKYMVLCDIDEYIIPQSDMMTWHDMLKQMGNLTNLDHYASYSFYNTRFFDSKEHLPEAKLLSRMCSNISIPLWVNRTDRLVHPEIEINLKTIYQLQGVKSGNVHNVNTWRKGYMKRYQVPTDVGLLHHYRIGPSDMNLKYETLHNVTIMSKYAKTVLSRLEKRICTV